MTNKKPMLVFARPRVFGEEIRAVNEVLRSGWWGTGPKTQEFEKKMGKYWGGIDCLGLNSATAALELALDVFGVGPGDEVITTPLTFVSTLNVIVHRGAKPVLADIDSEDWNIDPKEIEKKITKKTKVILPVHLHGRPCQMKGIMRLAKKYKLLVLEDAAHGIEARYQGKAVGTIGDAGAWSFYVTKNLATGEGGMLTMRKKIWMEEARVKSLHGISKDAWKRYGKEGYQHYEAVYPGYKFNLMDIQAALGLTQLGRIENNWRIRKKYWGKIIKGLEDLEELQLPVAIAKGDRHAYHLMAIRLRPEKLKVNRDQFMTALQAERIGVGVHFTPIYQHKFYRENYPNMGKGLKSAELVGNNLISLPFYPHMTVKEVNRVIEAVRKLTKRYGK
jgi:dTDP-4-amino-4,6-dideoxygalactose transaminase